jgi:DNA-directed RNA polymerase
MVPTFKFKKVEQERQWNSFKKNSYKLMVLLANNEVFWFTHAYDKRGRMYSRGYQVNTQGMAFQKACIDFADDELVDVPTEYRL